MKGLAGHIWRFSGCAFDERRRELRVDGKLVDVEVKPLDVLLQLLLRSGEVVTKEELLDAVWPSTEVVEGSLPTAVSKLRKALRPYDDLVVTVPRAGYLLAAASTREDPAPAEVWPRLAFQPGDPVPTRALWRLERRLALSPFREVWLAANPKTGEQRVFKFALDERGLQSLKREVALARLLRQSGRHAEGFVRLLEWNFDEHPYFVESEYAGPDLHEWASAQGGLANVPLDARMRILAQTARSVASAHALDILHKDLKPGNVLVSAITEAPGVRVRLGDLGSASLVAPRELAALDITDLALAREDQQPGAGIAMYAAPEVLAGQSPSRASDVYALGLMLYQLAAGDFRRPLAPDWEADVDDAALRELIASAAAGDPGKRLESASALATRLEAPRSGAADVASATSPRGRLRTRAIWAAVATLAIAGSAMLAFRTTPAAPARPLRTVAVLPLTGVAAPGDSATLGMALADEVAAILVRVRGLGVRPVRSDARVPSDPRGAGSELGVSAVISGRFATADGKLRVALSAIDVATGRLLWQDTIQSPASSLVSMQVQLALRVRGELGRALGGEPPSQGSEPANEEGYQLFLRAAGHTTDPVENRSAIDLLERASRLDPNYAPVWQALAKRAYFEGRYGGGGPGWLSRAEAAGRRAVELDPESPAAANLAVMRVERGELLEALRWAEDAVRRRPDSVEAHFALSYVLRFAGLLRESAEHCETAYLLDPRNSTSGVRSCAAVFLLLGDAPRTMNYLRLDEGSLFETTLLIDLHLRQGRRDDALRLAASSPQAGGGLLGACAADPRSVHATRAADAVTESSDPETNYFNAARLSYCGRLPESESLLRKAIEGGYCSFPAMEQDPFLDAIRERPGYAALRESGKSCQQRFTAGR